MPQLFPTQWILLVNMSFLLIHFTLSMFNFKLGYQSNKKVKSMIYKNWKW